MAHSVCQPLKLKPHGYPGVLITFCGVDGSGKSSLIDRLEETCREAGMSCLRTYTPTGRIRQDPVFRSLVDDPCSTSSIDCSSYESAARVNVLGLLLSIMGDLVQHTTDTIIPALKRGDVVFCDRYVFTSQAEIGARSDLRETEPVLARIAEHVLQPDLAFGLTVSSETSSRRVQARNDASDRPPPMDFLSRQVAAYRTVFKANDLVVLDSERGMEETFARAVIHFAQIEGLAPVAGKPATPPRTAPPQVADGRFSAGRAADPDMEDLTVWARPDDRTQLAPREPAKARGDGGRSKAPGRPSDLSALGIDRRPSARPRRKRRRWAAAISIVSIAAAAAAASARYGAPVAVETATVTTAYATQSMISLNATGYVVAERKAAVASKAAGRLEWLGVVEGSKVKRGEVIARLESRDVAATCEQAAASVEVARANLEQGKVELNEAERNSRRSKELLRRKFVSAAEYDAAAARYAKARASIKSLEAHVAVAAADLEAAEVALDQTAIRAPFDGVVLSKHANVGDVVTPFSNALDTKGAVVTVADMSTLEVEADVSESSVGQVKIGQSVEIQLDAVPDRRLAGVVNRIVPTVDRAKATVLVKIKFLEQDERVLPDMSATVAFLSHQPSAMDREPLAVAPPAAVVERDGVKCVYVVSDSHAHQVMVETGRAVGEMIELRGVDIGEKVVLNPLDKVTDGAALRVAQQ